MPTVCRIYKHDEDTGCLQYVRCKGSHFFFPTFFYLLLLDLSINFPYILSCIYYYNSVLEQMMPTIFIQLDFVAWCDICIYVSQSVNQTVGQLNSWTVQTDSESDSESVREVNKWLPCFIRFRFCFEFDMSSVLVLPLPFWFLTTHKHNSLSFSLHLLKIILYTSIIIIIIIGGWKHHNNDFVNIL